MACQIETVAIPAWFASASTVRIYVGNFSVGTTVLFEGAASDVEFLPQGLAYPTGLVSWGQLLELRKLS
jgi:hypothetical protein